MRAPPRRGGPGSRPHRRPMVPGDRPRAAGASRRRAAPGPRRSRHQPAGRPSPSAPSGGRRRDPADDGRGTPRDPRQRPHRRPGDVDRATDGPGAPWARPPALARRGRRWSCRATLGLVPDRYRGRGVRRGAQLQRPRCRSRAAGRGRAAAGVSTRRSPGVMGEVVTLRWPLPGKGRRPRAAAGRRDQRAEVPALMASSPQQPPRGRRGPGRPGRRELRSFPTPDRAPAGRRRCPSRRIVQRSIFPARRCVPLLGSRASVVRTRSSDSASTASTTWCSPPSGPPSTTKPASTSWSMTDACAGQSDCSSIGRRWSQCGPVRTGGTSVTRKADPRPSCGPALRESGRPADRPTAVRLFRATRHGRGPPAR